jgi:hypothetical protein
MNNTCVFQWSALLPVVLTLIATQQKDTILADLCYTKWALEAFVIANAQKYSWLSASAPQLINHVPVCCSNLIKHNISLPSLSLWLQLFRRVAHNPVWLAGQERLRHRARGSLYSGPHRQRGTLPLCSLLLHGHLPEELREGGQGKHTRELSMPS